MPRKLDVGTVLSRTFEIYKDQFTLLIPAALVVFVPVAIINALLGATGSVIVIPITIAIGAIAGSLFSGMIVNAVRDMLDGRRDETIGSLLRSAAPVIGPLILASILAGIGLLIGFILLVIPFFFLLTFWAVVAPVIVVERPGVIPAFRRSMELVKGHGWQVFGVLVVFFLISIVAGGILGAAFAAVDPAVGSGISNLLVNVFVTPLSAIAAAIMFFQLRELKGEGQLVPGAQPAAVGPGQPGPAAPAAPGGAAQPAPGGPQAPPAGGPESPPPGSGQPGG